MKRWIPAESRPRTSSRSRAVKAYWMDEKASTVASDVRRQPDRGPRARGPGGLGGIAHATSLQATRLALSSARSALPASDASSARRSTWVAMSSTVATITSNSVIKAGYRSKHRQPRLSVEQLPHLIQAFGGRTQTFGIRPRSFSACSTDSRLWAACARTAC